MQTRFQKRPFDDSLSTMSRHLHKQKMVWDYGWQAPSKKGEQKQQLWIYLYDCQPWEMPHTPCRSNCRVVMRTYSKSTEVCEEEVLVGAKYENGGSRRILRLQLSQPYGRLGLHVLVYWIFRASRSGRFKDYQAFRDCGKQVDHGAGGHPHILDWRTLQLLPGSGPGSNPSQGASLRYCTYGPQGGLSAVVARSVQKKPASAPAKRQRVALK